MKRILYVVQGASGGVSRHLVDLISNLNSSEFEIAIVFNSNFEDERFSKWRKSTSKIKFYDIPGLVRPISPLKDFKATIQVLKIIRKFRPDVLHAHSSKAGVVGRIAARIGHVNSVLYTPHGYAFLSSEFSARKRAIYAFAEKILSHYFTDYTINCSYSENKYALLRKIDVKEKFVVIPNAIPKVENIDFEAQRKRLDMPNSAKVVGTMARVCTQKNPDLFEKIAMETIKLDSSIKFVWVGKNPKNRTSSVVDYRGEMEDTQRLIAGLNLYLSTSLFEGLSYSLLEASSVGAKVLASNVPGNDEFIRSYEGAVGFDLMSNPSNIAKEIIRLLSDNSIPIYKKNGDEFLNFIQETSELYND